MLNRVFIDWKMPLLKEAAGILAENAQNEGSIDLSGLIVATPASRAGRRLLELLVFEAEQRDCSLSPPQFTTPGALPELLYKAKLPQANSIERRLAWIDAVKGLSDKEKAALSSVLSSEKLSIQLSIAKQLDSLYRELAAEGCSFHDAAKACEEMPDCHDEDRWYVLESVLKSFRKILLERGLVDTYTARTEALDSNQVESAKEIVLLAAPDLNSTVKSFIDQLAEKVSVFIHAPEEKSESFDKYGCLIVSEWKDILVEVPRDKIHIESKNKQQAERALALISDNAQDLTYEDVSCGVVDPALASFVKEELGKFGVPVRDAAGRSLSEAPPIELLKRISGYLASKSYADFASLVRHPDVEAYLMQEKDIPRNVIEILDRYHLKFLQAKISSNVFGAGDLPADLQPVVLALNSLLQPLNQALTNPSDWSAKLRLVLLSLYKEQELDQILKDSLLALSKALSSFQELLTLVEEEISFSEFSSILFSELENLQLPPDGETEAVELLGWLELQLDDAEHLICLGMNEGFVPESVVADPFFPDSLRTRLGLLDNNRRFARDKYVLKTLLQSKKNLHFTAGRADTKGEPLTISRLLLSCEKKELADRVHAFYAEIPDRAVESPSEELSIFSPSMPEKLTEAPNTISATAFRTYLSCPYRFYLRHVLKLEALSDRDLELDGRGFGIAAHEVLKKFGESVLKDSADSKEIKDFLNLTLDSYWNENFGNGAHAAVYIQKEQLRERLENFAAEQAARRQAGWEIKFVEKRFSNVFIETKKGNVELRGQIDRIDYNKKENKWAIFDYKTGDNKLDPRTTHYAERKEEWKDLQLPAYLFALKEMTSELGECEVGYVTLSAKQEETKFVPWKKYTDALQLDAEAKMKEVALAVLQQKFWPPAKGLIAFDDYSALCGNMKFADFEGEVVDE